MIVFAPQFYTFKTPTITSANGKQTLSILECEMSTFFLLRSFVAKRLWECDCVYDGMGTCNDSLLRVLLLICVQWGFVIPCIDCGNRHAKRHVYIGVLSMIHQHTRAIILFGMNEYFAGYFYFWHLCVCAFPTGIASVAWTPKHTTTCANAMKTTHNIQTRCRCVYLSLCPHSVSNNIYATEIRSSFSLFRVLPHDAYTSLFYVTFFFEIDVLFFFIPTILNIFSFIFCVLFVTKPLALGR